MDTNERQKEQQLTIDKNAQINVVVNRPETDETEIDLVRVFHTMKLQRRIYAWVLVLCLVAGVCAPLLLYQFNKPMHMQPLYRNHPFVTATGSGRGRTNAYISGTFEDVGADIFRRGLCLPSDNKMTEEQQERIIDIIHRCFK